MENYSTSPTEQRIINLGNWTTIILGVIVWTNVYLHMGVIASQLPEVYFTYAEAIDFIVGFIGILAGLFIFVQAGRCEKHSFLQWAFTVIGFLTWIFSTVWLAPEATSIIRIVHILCTCGIAVTTIVMLTRYIISICNKAKYNI